MNKMDELQNAVNEGLRSDVTILDSTDDVLICRYQKGEYTEYVTFRHDYKSIFQGHYYTTRSSDVEEARERAWVDYRDRARL